MIQLYKSKTGIRPIKRGSLRANTIPQRLAMANKRREIPKCGKKVANKNPIKTLTNSVHRFHFPSMKKASPVPIAKNPVVHTMRNNIEVSLANEKIADSAPYPKKPSKKRIADKERTCSLFEKYCPKNTRKIPSPDKGKITSNVG